jgi:serine/threonine-protein kinase
VRTNERLGEYRIERMLGKGRACIEYAGAHLVLPRRAALKVMASAAMQPAAVEVLREACLLEALHHPGIVRVFEAGLLPDRRAWFARELVEGPTVASSLAPGAIDRIDVIALLRDIAEVLAHAHQRGVVHANLRPDRIVVTGRTREFSICITDWSDARAHDASTPPVLDAIASWYYTSPEAIRGDALDDRADVFSLGAIAYRLLTGRLPFDGTVARTAEGGTQHVPTEVHCPEAPRELTVLVDQMLAHDHWDRPSAAEVFADLEWLAHVISMPAASAAGLVRVRQPRWTPEFAMHDSPAVESALHADRVHDRD